jgi:hypothetical protein
LALTTIEIFIFSLCSTFLFTYCRVGKKMQEIIFFA